MSNGHDTESDAALFRSVLPIESKLERARLHLLDLTARNRLLNIPRSKTRSAKLIQTVDERSSEVYRLLVKENKAFTFIPGRVDSEDGEEEKDEIEIEDFAQPGDDGMDERGVANRHADTRLQTRLTSKGLQKRLLSLYFDARTLEEEQGVNVLFLALGTLKWIDPNNAANVRYAPLVLVPVSLERATAGDRFKLRWRQEDPSSNLSLEAMADRVHLLKLPVFEASDDFDITAYCEGVQKAVSSKKGWEVATDDIVLGFFSFSKFLMYRDLSPETWPAKASLAQQPLIQSLLRDGFPPVAASIDDDAPIDEELPPERLLHIMDADSSQTLAIHDARQGQNLVIQGPPGTGKSQTIANIIAGAVADGRTVLFVAEKMAALDVVKRRLDATGIGDACLELHSNKANKRAVLEELKRTWELSSPKGAFAGNLHQRLTNARDRLNTHVERLHRTHAHAGITPYEVMGHLTRLRDEGCPPNDIHLPDAVTWGREDLRERRVLLRELCERINAIGAPDQHPWRGVGLDVVLPNQLARLLDRVASIRTGLAALRQRHSEIGRSLQQPVPMSFDNVNRLYDLAERIASAPPIAGNALGHAWWTQRLDDIKNLCVLGHRWHSAWEALRPSVTEDAIGADLTEILQALPALPADYGSEAFRRAHSLTELLPTLAIEIGRLKTALGLDDAVDTLAAASMAATTGQRVAAAPNVSPDVFAASVWDSGVEQAAELAEAVARIEDARTKTEDKVLNAAWEADTERERQVVRIKGSSFFRFLSGDWRRANALLRSMVRDPKQPMEDLLNLLDTVGDSQVALRTVRASDSLGQAAFGADWRGEKSNAAPLRALVAWMRSLRGLGAAPRLIAARMPDRSDIGTRASRVYQLVNQVRPLLEAFWGDLGTAATTAFDEAATVTTTRLSMLLSRATVIAKADAASRQVLASPDVAVGERLAVMEQLRNTQTLHQSLRDNKPLGDAVFGSLWRGADSDWPAIDSVVAWVERSDNVRMLAAGLADRNAPWQISQKSKEEDSIWQAGFEGLVRDLRSELHTLFGIEALGAIPFPDIEARFEAWNEHSEQLSKWVAFRDRAERGKATGLTDVVERLETSRLAPEEALDAFDMAYFEALLNDMVAQDGELGRFDGELHDRAVKEFSELDRESLLASRVHAIQAHHRKMPTKDSGVGAIGVLRGEMARRRGHMPIRKLMNEAATAIQALKPVFMMSPLSIAQFLPPARLTFDLLVMDEASQIQPVDAFGAIARCKQVVVVGDERQLPPTTFFSKVTEGDDDEDETAHVSDIESILGLFRARGLSERMLRWHYRSRHQSLIAVSNSQFYENKLAIVPSPYTSEAGIGLNFHHLPNGVFDSGGTGTNHVEALAIAEAILQHVREHPDQSLGVATFSVRQRRAILDQVEHLRREHSETESFFHAHPTEPFFVKNLENVQGDERDVMFISVGYGRNANGVMSMRFGPLGNEGGERRLNVLISRAKLRCEVFSSITDDDIDLERARGKGVAAFKLFLRYARSGRLDLPGTERAEETDVFESQVAAALHSRGYVVHPRVGIAGLFIDLAVADPEAPGRYVLGIECDGRSYQQARSARDRDRLRRTALEDHGWAIHRIWSANWFHRPQEELHRLINAIESARNRHAGEHHSPHRPRIMPVEMFTIEREDETDDLLGSDSEPAGAPAYRATGVQAIRGYTEIPSVPAPQLAALVDQVVSAEGPVHFDVVVQRIRDAWGAQRAGSRIQSTIQGAVGMAVRAKSVRRTGDFLSKPGGPVVARDRSAADSLLRRPEMIAPTEWQEAIVAVVRRNFGVRKSELPSAVARWLGFSSTSAAIRELVEAEVKKVVRAGRLRQQGELLEAV